MQARTFWATLASVPLLTLAIVASASAQGISGFGGSQSGGINGPTVSPYLNLLQINSQGIIPYQNLVTPQIDQGNAIRQQQSAINRLQSQVNSQSASQQRTSRSTGHNTLFLNYSHYFPSYGGGQGRR